MEENTRDTFSRAYARLSSLRKNINDIKYGIEEKYVCEYHEILNKLQDLGVDVSEFRIPDSMVKPQIGIRSTDIGGKVSCSYSEDKYVDKPFILTKLDAILGYFEIVTSEKPREIGFRTPKKQ